MADPPLTLFHYEKSERNGVKNSGSMRPELMDGMDFALQEGWLQGRLVAHAAKDVGALQQSDHRLLPPERRRRKYPVLYLFPS